jgi:hypothetical protein
MKPLILSLLIALAACGGGDPECRHHHDFAPENMNLPVCARPSGVAP